jgi:hypothetical protein
LYPPVATLGSRTVLSALVIIVGVLVVARLVLVDHAVSAAFGLAVLVAAIAGRKVPVITSLAGPDVGIAANVEPTVSVAQLTRSVVLTVIALFLGPDAAIAAHIEPTVLLAGLSRSVVQAVVALLAL